LQFNTLAEGTVRGTISNGAQTFQSLGRQNPTKDADNELSILLLQQFWAVRNKDPKEKQQKDLPFSVLDELAKRQVTETDKLIMQLTIGTVFFACRSWEDRIPLKMQTISLASFYCDSSGPSEMKTLRRNNKRTFLSLSSMN
jgi:hypothetical protein